MFLITKFDPSVKRKISCIFDPGFGFFKERREIKDLGDTDVVRIVTLIVFGYCNTIHAKCFTIGHRMILKLYQIALAY